MDIPTLCSIDYLVFNGVANNRFECLYTNTWRPITFSNCLFSFELPNVFNEALNVPNEFNCNKSLASGVI